MNKLPEAVTSKFKELYVTLNKATDDLKIEGAEAILMGDFSQVTNLNDLCQKLQALEVEVKSTVNNFDAKYNAHQAKTVTFRKKNRNRTRKPSTPFRVILSNQVIEEHTIAQTFLKALRVIGFDRVAKLNMMVTNIPLMAKKSVNGYQTQKRCDGWYITTHVNKHTATNVLEGIGKQLRIPIKIES